MNERQPSRQVRRAFSVPATTHTACYPATGKTWILAAVALVFLGSCTSGGAGRSATGGAATPRATAPSVSSPSANTAPYQVGRCLDVRAGAKGWGSCARPHDYEVMLAQRLPVRAVGTYARSTMRRACHAALPSYLKSPDAHASRLQAATAGPSRGKDGAQWFACLVSERAPDGGPLRRTGSLAGALAGGLGAFQKCLVGEPLEDGPPRIVPCDQPHRSEAVPGVLVLGAPTDPPPTLRQMTSRALDHCEKVVNAYLGGSRPGVRPSSLSPLPDEWRDGDTSAICYAVSKNPVTGSLRGR